MAERPGFLAGLRRSDVTDRFADAGLDARPSGGSTAARLGDPNAQPADDVAGTGPDFDPIWGTLGVIEEPEPPAIGLTGEEARSA